MSVGGAERAAEHGGPPVGAGPGNCGGSVAGGPHGLDPASTKAEAMKDRLP